MRDAVTQMVRRRPAFAPRPCRMVIDGGRRAVVPCRLAQGRCPIHIQGGLRCLGLHVVVRHGGAGGGPDGPAVPGPREPFVGRLPLGAHEQSVHAEGRRQRDSRPGTPYLNTTISDWSQSTVLDLTKVAGRDAAKNLQAHRRPRRGLQRELRQQRLAGHRPDLDHRRNAHHAGHVTKVNDTYFNTRAYNTTAVAEPGDVPGGRPYASGSTTRTRTSTTPTSAPAWTTRATQDTEPAPEPARL